MVVLITRVGAVSLAALLFLAVVPVGHAQSFGIVHGFTGTEGASPYAGVTLDAAGSVYGTAYNGDGGYGSAFRLMRQGNSWTLSTLHTFRGGNDGGGPTGTSVFGPDGALYGTTQFGGSGSCVNGNLTGCGTVFRMTPGVSPCETVSCPWHETVIHSFTNAPDGSVPIAGVTLDGAGNIYGTTFEGGIVNDNCPSGCGSVFELSPSNGGWTETVLYRFSGGDDGAYVGAGVVLDASGNLYGTTQSGGAYVYGTVFELVHSNGGWTKQTLYTFQGAADGGDPFGGVALDRTGTLYGTTCLGGSANGGTVYSLTHASGGWIQTVIWNGLSSQCPYDAPIIDAAGNIYATTTGGGTYYSGSIFKLSPSSGGWIYSNLHDLNPVTDGYSPWASPALDLHGNLFGTTSGGGQNEGGTVWEVTP
jgi:uncharacterized repeat protein (TIGR03803 family)